MLNSSKFIDESVLEQFEASLRKRLLAIHSERNEVRDCLLLLLAIHTGARASELLSLTVGSLNFMNNTVYIKALKGSNDRELPLQTCLISALQAHCEALAQGAIPHPNLRLFSVSYPRLDQIWRLYRPCNAKFHALRHSRAISLYKKTRNIHLVKQVLGHRSINSTMIYLDFVEGQEALRKAMSA